MLSIEKTILINRTAFTAMLGARIWVKRRGQMKNAILSVVDTKWTFIEISNLVFIIKSRYAALTHWT